jgi:uncharacterized damage-inducible protein DinB
MDEAFHVLRKTPDTLRELLEGVNLEASSRSKEGQWSLRQILIHLIDCEYIYGFRFRLIMAEKEPRITPIDQDLWAAAYSYGDLDATQLIRGFTPLRRVNLELLQSVDPSFFDRPANHPEFGTITVKMLIPHLAAHDLSHLQQIRERGPAA